MWDGRFGKALGIPPHQLLKPRNHEWAIVVKANNINYVPRALFTGNETRMPYCTSLRP